LDAELEEMGPIDYLLIEWPGKQPTGEAAPHLLDLVERGLIRVLDLVFIRKDEDGSVAGVENRWAAPLAVALRRSGGQLVASGRIPVQAVIAALDAAEESGAAP
jgi:hypothetical protein